MATVRCWATCCSTSPWVPRPETLGTAPASLISLLQRPPYIQYQGKHMMNLHITSFSGYWLIFGMLAMLRYLLILASTFTKALQLTHWYGPFLPGKKHCNVIRNVETGKVIIPATRKRNTFQKPNCIAKVRFDVLNQEYYLRWVIYSTKICNWSFRSAKSRVYVAKAVFLGVEVHKDS